jgi:hypothetical protein
MKIFNKPKFKVGEVVEDNGGCGYYLAGKIEKVDGDKIYLKGYSGWIHTANLRHIDIMGRDFIVGIKGQRCRVRVL